MNTVTRGATQKDIKLAITKWLGGARDREGGGRQGCVLHGQQKLSLKLLWRMIVLLHRMLQYNVFLINLEFYHNYVENYIDTA